jgi:alpha-1,3-rhamnosyltransferase
VDEVPAVSVLLNSYNQGRYVAQAVESVLGQTFRDFELIVLDNGSTDGSHDLLRKYESDPRVRLVLHRENVAISRRFNEAVGLARAELVSFLYSDDYYLPTKLERQVEAFATLDGSWAVVYCPAYGLNELTGERWIHICPKTTGSILEVLLRDGHFSRINMLSPMVRRSVLLRYPFYEDLFAEGEAWFFRAAMKHKFFYVDEPLLVLRDHESNAGKAVQRNIEMTEVSLERLRLAPEFPAECLPSFKLFRATMLRDGGWSTVRVGGDVSWARHCLIESVRIVPAMALHPRVLAGVTLSLLPDVVRSSINRIGNAVRRSRMNRAYVEGYR